MHVEDLPAKTQDYLKAIWNLHERISEKVAPGDIAERVGGKKLTTSEAVKKLAARGLVSHEPRRDISLSDRGRGIALIMVRHHRLIENFLVSTPGYTWDEVHEEAGKFGHVISEEFISHIDAVLEFPERDPYSDPIPSVSGTIASAIRIDLMDIGAGAMVVADRINNPDPELPRYLATSGVGPGAVLRAEATLYAGMHVFATLGEVGDTEPKKIHVADSASWTIEVVSITN